MRQPRCNTPLPTHAAAAKQRRCRLAVAPAPRHVQAEVQHPQAGRQAGHSRQALQGARSRARRRWRIRLPPCRQYRRLLHSPHRPDGVVAGRCSAAFAPAFCHPTGACHPRGDRAAADVCASAAVGRRGAAAGAARRQPACQPRSQASSGCCAATPPACPYLHACDCMRMPSLLNTQRPTAAALNSRSRAATLLLCLEAGRKAPSWSWSLPGSGWRACATPQSAPPTPRSPWARRPAALLPAARRPAARRR